MIMNIDDLLNYYNDEYYFTYSQMDDAQLHRWSDADLARRYLEKYLLSTDEFQKTWNPIQDKLFDIATCNLDRPVFRNRVSVFPQIGGVALTSNSLKEIGLVMQEVGDTELVVVTSGETQDSSGALTLRMKYPISTSWEEIMSGGFISTVLFEMWHNDYFIFGKSGRWARYVANDYKIPIALLAVDESLESDVSNYFELSVKESEELRKIIPDSYKENYKIHF